MSKHGVENALFQLSNDPAAAQLYITEPAAFLGRFNLEADERALLEHMNVEELAARRLNWMLLMGAYQAIHGRAKNGEYLQRISGFRTRSAKGDE
ncbi:MAG: hypothetical protein JWL74_1319 [Alphaproteobacteria bacterium]|nr:hypothetical protein [Alphaproteobacteria bacterium]